MNSDGHLYTQDNKARVEKKIIVFYLFSSTHFTFTGWAEEIGISKKYYDYITVIIVTLRIFGVLNLAFGHWKIFWLL